MADFDNLDDFSVELGNFDVKQVKKFDRMWRTEQGGSVSSGVVYYNGLIYFGCANYNIYCVRPENGELVWKFKTEGCMVESRVTIHDGVLYMGTYDRNMYALNADTGKLIWKYTTNDKIASTATYSDGMIYFGGKDQYVYALDASNGSLVWKYRTYDCMITEPLVVGDKVLVGCYDHFAYCLDKKTGRLIWRFETQGEIHNTNAFAHKDGIVYFGSFDNYLRAVDIETGRLIWKAKAGNYGIGVSPVIDKDIILQATRDGMLFAFDMNGRLLWKYVGSDEDVMGIPCVHNGLIYIGSVGDWCMHCFTPDGKELWRFKAEMFVYEWSVMLGNHLLFPSWDCNVYCIDIRTRQVVWKFRCAGSPAYVPPPYEAFEFQTTVSEKEFREERRKDYSFEFREEEDNTSEYKSDITYQMGTTYREKGKYQVDSREEEF